MVQADYSRLAGGRANLMRFLKSRGISTQVHYMPIYRHPYYSGVREHEKFCPSAEQYYRSCLSLPLFPDMTDSDVERVVYNLVDAQDKFLRE